MDLKGIRTAVLTVSDRGHAGETEDVSGPRLRAFMTERGAQIAAQAIVPDNPDEIAAVVRRWADEEQVRFIVLTGGTGIGPRDVTPEALKPLLDRELPGFGELMRSEGMKHTRRAVLSRSGAGTRGRALILYLPGSPLGALQSLEVVVDLVGHALEMMDGSPHRKHAHGHKHHQH